MIATAITFAILWFVADMMGQLLRQNGGKIRAALEGKSAPLQFDPIGSSATPRAAAPAPAVLRAAA